MKDNYINKMQDLVKDFSDDFKKFEEDNNKSAGTRARVSLQNIKKLAQEIRIKIQEKKNG